MEPPAWKSLAKAEVFDKSLMAQPKYLLNDAELSGKYMPLVFASFILIDQKCRPDRSA
jgi:hypothetical protein